MNFALALLVLLYFTSPVLFQCFNGDNLKNVLVEGMIGGFLYVRCFSSVLILSLNYFLKVSVEHLES